jgi:hypothetical protein
MTTKSGACSALRLAEAAMTEIALPGRARLSSSFEMKISVAVGAAVVAQGATALIWAGAAAERLAALERRAGATIELLERTARLEEQVAAARASLIRIETKIDEGAS